jgi:hypothetical protein
VTDPLTLWLLTGERGLSSEAMVRHLTGSGSGRPDHPYDPADLRRCRLLVERVPAIARDLANMRTASPTWARIIDHWDELCSLMDSESPNWRKGRGNAPKTYALMRKLLEVAA